MASKIFLCFDAVMRIALLALVLGVFSDLLHFMFHGAFYDTIFTRPNMLLLVPFGAYYYFVKVPKG